MLRAIRRIRPTSRLVAVLALSLPAAAWGQYDPPRGGDPNARPGCQGVAAKISVTGGSMAFEPAVVTVDPGQPACWTWAGTDMEHNVTADDLSFTSGPPGFEGTFQKTFDTPGVYGFHCQVHGSASAGMRGTVVVRGAVGTGPGTLEIAATQTVSENAGALTVAVLRVGGGDGAASVKYKTVKGTAKVGRDFLARTGTLRWDAGDQEPKTFTVPIKNDSAVEPDETFTIQLSSPTGAALGSARSTVTIDDEDGPQCDASLVAPAQLRASGQSASAIRLTWAAESSAATATAIERRSPGGAFRKIAAVAADLGSFVDAGLAADEVYEYRIRAESGAGASSFSATVSGSTDGASGACDSGEHAVCLGGGRFEASVLWRPSGVEGRRGRGMPLGSADAGLFSLPAAEDLPLVVNVSDLCDRSGHFAVSLAALADLEFTVKIRDTQTGRTWVHHHADAEPALSVRDVEAFATCP